MDPLLPPPQERARRYPGTQNPALVLGAPYRLWLLLELRVWKVPKALAKGELVGLASGYKLSPGLLQSALVRSYTPNEAKLSGLGTRALSAKVSLLGSAVSGCDRLTVLSYYCLFTAIITMIVLL